MATFFSNEEEELYLDGPDKRKRYFMASERSTAQIVVQCSSGVVDLNIRIAKISSRNYKTTQNTSRYGVFKAFAVQSLKNEREQNKSQ